MIQETFQSLPLDTSISLKKLENHYEKYMDNNWKHNMIDIVYFFEQRNGLTIKNNDNGFISTITISKTQNKNIEKIITNYRWFIVKIWPELLLYNSNNKE